MSRAARLVEAADLGDAEVEHLHDLRAVGARREEEVPWLEIAVHHALRVRLGDRLARLKDVFCSQFDGEGGAASDQTRERLAFEVLHDDERRAVLGDLDVEHARDVWALELHEGAGLALEARDHVGLVHRLAAQELERDVLVEAQVTREHDDAHAASPDQTIDAVLGTDHGADRRPLGVHRRNCSLA